MDEVKKFDQKLKAFLFPSSLRSCAISQYELTPVVKALGEVSKTPVTEIVREGGVPLLSVNFFPLGFLEPTVR